ncbi:transaldolase [Phycicoccus sp.]|uniref:transaldolase n=1 Tax=Phycicoccus sp. TaxID=1902410 RepID=UPI002BCF73BF|nr:transaldolase [Phycicoccus sp.]HMM97276.1 transaldolase [Phycicoccus sp.]
MTSALEELTRNGVSIWLDDMSRERLTGGDLQDLVDHRQVSGVTANPSIFASALKNGRAYDDQIGDLAAWRVSTDAMIRHVMAYDIRGACDVLRPVYERTGHVDGRASIEVDPRIAHDAERTTAEAKGLAFLIDRPNLFVKIPATAEGLFSITDATAAGISVNVTLIFGLDRYDQVMDAYLTGLEEAQQAGRDLSAIHSVASFFVSRVDVEIDKRLDEIGTERAAGLRGRAAIANARLAYERYTRMTASPRWQALRDAGANPQRPLWASTGVKNPAYEDTMYVTQLVAPDTVNTMPEATLDAVADHGDIRGNTISGTYDSARHVLAELEQVGISYADVVQLLEDQGIEKFTKAYAQLEDSVRTASGRL